MQVKGKVVLVEVDVDIPKNGGGTYQGARLVFKDENGKMVEQAFHNNAFRFNPGMKETLTSLQPGDGVELTKEKSDAGFWNVKGISRIELSQNVTTPASKPENRATTSPKSTYETPEERAKRQVYIVRQSSLSCAVSLLEANKTKATPENVIEVAKVFEAYVFGQQELVEA